MELNSAGVNLTKINHGKSTSSRNSTFIENQMEQIAIKKGCHFKQDNNFSTMLLFSS